MIRFWIEKKNLRWLQGICLSLAASLIFTAIAPAYAQASIWTDRRKSLDEMETKRQKTEKPWQYVLSQAIKTEEAEFQLPEDMGRLIDSHWAEGAKGKT